ncbi:hypothetical protein M0802_016024, partial [Mischocyttarus mexicanus]
MDKSMSQKEYLKKYLSSGHGEEKKKKKKVKVGQKKVKIIDDDIDLSKLRPIEDGEFDIFINREDAPQIAGIIDERGPIDFSDKKKWKIVADNEDGELRFKQNNSVIAHEKERESNTYDSDLSPPRKNNQTSDSNLSPHRKSRKNNDSNLSPHRKSRKTSD